MLFCNMGVFLGTSFTQKNGQKEKVEKDMRSSNYAIKTKYPFSWCYDPFFSKPIQNYYISTLCTSINYSYLGYVWTELVKHMQKHYKWTNRRKQCDLDLLSRVTSRIDHLLVWPTLYRFIRNICILSKAAPLHMIKPPKM